MAVRDDDKQRILQVTDIVRIIGEQISLRPKGRELAGLCPFHDDKNPSMYVSPAKQIFKCFSCGVGGDVFSFVMNYHKMTFPEAMRHLADRAGITLSQRGSTEESSDTAGRSMRQRITTANEQALSFYHEMLDRDRCGECARDYVRHRNIDVRMQQSFQLGYSPDSWDELSRHVVRKGWDIEAFEAAGLVIRRKEGGSYYDRFRHRLIFPIFDAVGRPIAFGGRKLCDEDEPKYLNSPETSLFDKSVTLYGLHQAKKPVISTKTAVIVEGYTDVIAAHQSGEDNVVATLGTALTGGHVSELRRYADRVVLVFDADEAGQKAADRAVEIFLADDLDVAIAILPVGQDPADLLGVVGGLDKWRESIASAQDALAYQFDRVARGLDSAETITGRQKLIESYLSRLAQLGLTRSGSLRRSFVLQRLAGMLHMSESAIDELLQRHIPSRAAYHSTVVESEVMPSQSPVDDVAGVYPRSIELAERQLVGALLRDNGLFHHQIINGGHFDELVLPDEFVTTNGRAIYRRVYEKLASDDEVTLGGLLSDFAEEGQQQLSEWMAQVDFDIERATGGDRQLVEEMFHAAACAMVQYLGETDYRKRKELMVEESAVMAEHLMEHRRTNPSPVRIARL